MATSKIGKHDLDEELFKKISESPDWNQNDETAPDYIKNRTHWVEEKNVDIIPETTVSNPVTTTEDYNEFDLTSEHIKEVPRLTENVEYTVTWNGTEYKSVAKMVTGVGGIVCLGNDKKILDTGDTGEPFFIMPDTLNIPGPGEDILCKVGALDGSTSCTFKVSNLTTVVHKIDKKYLPEIQNKNILDGSQNGSVRTIGANTGLGVYAFAEGCETSALGEFSHAEGLSTTASGYGSHAEGRGTIASGRYSHAEGRNTKTSSLYQHVQGKYNVEDAEDKYAHIVGNGEYSDDGSLNSNAHTLDWYGNAWFQGDIKLGGTSQDDTTAKSVLTSDYITAGTTDLEAGVSALPAGHIYLVLE